MKINWGSILGTIVAVLIVYSSVYGNPLKAFQEDFIATILGIIIIYLILSALVWIMNHKDYQLNFGLKKRTKVGKKQN